MSSQLRCPCGGRYEDVLVEVRPTGSRPDALVLRNVEQHRCDDCGSRTYTVATLERVEMAFRWTAAPRSTSSSSS